MTLLTATILDLLKLAILSFVVYRLASLLLEKYLSYRQQSDLIRHKPKADSELVRLRYQAYERLLLMSERLSIPKLIRRIKVDGMSAEDFKLALFVAVNQEYEHNITQQIYTTGKLWDLIELSRSQIMALIDETCQQLPEQANSKDLEHALYDKLGELSAEPATIAKKAIAAEARTLIGSK